MAKTRGLKHITRSSNEMLSIFMLNDKGKCEFFGVPQLMHFETLY